MKRKYRYLVYLAVLIFVVACSDSRYSSRIPFPCEWPASPGYAPDANIDRQNIAEPSGICFHPGRKTLFVVSDEGEIAEMKTDGTPVARTKVPGDLEGITVDPSTGFVYVVVEGADIILEFDPDKSEVTRRFPISREFQGDPNFLQKQQTGFDNGIESLVFIPVPGHAEGGTFYAGNQEDPSCVMEIHVPLKSSRTAEAEAKILRVLPFKIQDPAAMYFDPETKCLNVVSDTDNILVEITLDGKLVKEYAFPGNDQEGVCTDEDGYIYICQDSNGILKLKDLRKR
jgi:uncharacterized protein YjiK